MRRGGGALGGAQLGGAGAGIGANLGFIRDDSLIFTPPSKPNMLLLGLTGSIATGKSTVSSVLSNAPYKIPIIDADVLARRVVEPGTPGYKKIVAHFSSTTPDLLLPPSEEKSSGTIADRRGQPRGSRTGSA